MNNRILTIILVVLLVAFAVNKLYRGNQGISFDKTFSSLEVGTLDKVEVNPKGDVSTYTLVKESGVWKGMAEDNTVRLNQERVQSFLNALADIQIQRLAAKSSEKWIDFEVDEDNGTKITVFSEGKRVLDFIVGRFAFNQQTRSATSYLRKNGEEEVFAMDGFASMTLNQDFNSLRYNKVLDIDQEQVNKVNLKEGDLSLTLRKEGERWVDFLGNSVDSVAMASYLNGLSTLTSNQFSSAAEASEDAGISIAFTTANGNIRTVPIYPDSTGFIVGSAEESGLYLRSDSTGLFKKLVLDLKETIPAN